MNGQDLSGLSTGLKRQREPLFDTEDNVSLSSAEVTDFQKRRRLEVLGEENLSPNKKSSTRNQLRSAEIEVKPDTPAISSVQSRVQQLTQGREGNAEFISRVERFITPVTPQTSPLPTKRCPLTLSDNVSNLQMKLEAGDMPSSKQALRIRQAKLDVIGDKRNEMEGSVSTMFASTGVQGEEHPIHNTGEESTVDMDVPPQEVEELEKGNAELISRVERFITPVTPQTSPLPTKRCPLTLSDNVSNLQMKLEAGDMPSSKQALRIRQKREEELRLLSRPIAENAFLKRSSSDPLLTEAKLDVIGDKRTEMEGSVSTMFASTGVQGEEHPIHNTETELNSHDETNTAEMIDQMFGEVLDVAAQRGLEEAEEGVTEDHDSRIATVTGREEKTATDIDTEKAEDVLKETHELEPSSDEELLTFQPRCVLSPLSKSVEAVFTPMRLAVSQLTNPSLVSPETSSPADSAPLYSINAYHTMSQSAKPGVQNVTPAVQRQVAAKSLPRPAINTKERILVLNEEAAKLQAIISQTLHTLSCCTNEEHDRGTLEEAEAEKLLLVSCEKREALLAEVSRLKELGSSVSDNGGDGEPDSSQAQLPCRGTVSISNVQLPLKVVFVCFARMRTGRPTHYFFVLIRYGPCNIIATPLATAVDVQNGDTISFPTSIRLQDIRSNFEIDVEVYSLRSNHSVTSSTMPALNTRCSSNFCLVGSHKITLASLGQSKFPLDKVKFEIRRLLGDEFQEKVPFQSPLEGNIYLQLDSESHSNVQNHGFLTMFEVVNGFGAWHRRFFVLEGNHLSYWNHPNDRESKAPEDSISLSTSSSHSVNRDSCARPFTFELISSNQAAPQDQQSNQAKCWFSADTREERADWMDKLNQVLLDLHTWSTRPPPGQW